MKPVLSFGRIMLGLAYVVYGYLHFAHTAADAAMVPQGVGRPVVWVILIGICWWAVALSFFTNILTRLSGVLASVLLFFVLFFAIGYVTFEYFPVTVITLISSVAYIQPYPLVNAVLEYTLVLEVFIV